MTFQPVLNRKQEEELIADYEDGWTIKEITIIYKISIRTIYRTLGKYSVPFRDNRRKKHKNHRELKPRVLKPCGTDAAYQRHRKAGQYPCTPCLEAHAERVNKYKKGNPRKLKPCGTDAAYQRHKRAGEKACRKCMDSHNTALRRRRKNRKKT